MFKSIVVNSLFEELKPSIVTALDSLNKSNFNQAKTNLGEILARVTDIKESDVSNIEVVLNEYYILKAYIKFLVSYSNTWQCIYEKQFSASWEWLQGSIGHLRDIKKFAYNSKGKHVEFFEDQVLCLEELYPYGVFFSIGAVVDHFECSICGKDIDSMECIHRKGALYSGEVAVAIARNITKLDHVSIVEHPVDKCCVPKYEDDDPQFNVLRYFSELLTSNKLKPLSFGELEHSTRIIANPEYIKLGRNDPCFCGSKAKFKNCCIEKRNIEGGHIQVISKPETAGAIMA